MNKGEDVTTICNRHIIVDPDLLAIDRRAYCHAPLQERKIWVSDYSD